MNLITLTKKLKACQTSRDTAKLLIKKRILNRKIQVFMLLLVIEGGEGVGGGERCNSAGGMGIDVMGVG